MKYSCEVPNLEPKVHRRILRFLNAARRPEDLMVPPQKEIPLIHENFRHGNEGAVHADEHREKKVKGRHLFDRELAKCVFEERERISPIYGFQNIRQLFEIKGFDARIFAHLTSHFNAAVNGEWEVVYDLLPAGEMPISVLHAAQLHTGQVLFIANAYSPDTLLWNPEDPNPATAFELLNGAATGLGSNRLACCGHSFLSNGYLLAVGGDAPTSKKAWKFDPVAKTWIRTAGDGSADDGDMMGIRWYPTTVTLGDDSERVLVASGGLNVGGTPVLKVEIYDEDLDSFTRVFGPSGAGGLPGGLDDESADRSFPKLYPGLHLLPNGQIFHPQTGERFAGEANDPAVTASFAFSALEQGEWTELPVDVLDVNRYKGMSVLLLRKQPADPDRLLVVGGGTDLATQQSIAIMDNPSATASWVTGPFPDGLARQEVNVVLLPDGTVFICGGLAATGGTCYIYDPSAGLGAGAFSPMDELEYERKHHSVALLLPSGKVMATGGVSSNSKKIEVFSPPYLFNPDGTLADRPAITSFPDPDASQTVLHGSTFEVSTANPSDITNVVLVRPMAVTHQTDTEQKVIQLLFTAGATTLSVTAPDARVYPYGPGGGHTHAIAGRAYYMLFIINSAGVPSEAKFIRLV